MSIDLANDWLRKEVATPSTYYGYNLNAAALDTDSTWSIRKVTTVATVDTVSWNEGRIFSFSAKWSEKEACFATPSGSLGVTWSVTKLQDSFYNTYSIINAAWTDLSGANLYRVLITDHLGKSYNYLGEVYQNTYTPTPITTEQSTTKFQFRGLSSYTYSLTVTAVNVAGISASTVTISA